MVKKSKTETIRGAWKRSTITIDPELTLNDLAAVGSADAAVAKLQPFADEVVKLRPRGATPEARVRAPFAQLRHTALQVLASEGYPTTPGWYRRNTVQGWVPVTPRIMKLRTRSGKAGSFCAWPYFDDIEELSRADIARNMIVEVDQFLRAYDDLGAAHRGRQPPSGGSPQSLPVHVIVAHLSLGVMAAYATFRAEVSNMADAANSGLKTREGAAKGGKDKGVQYGGAKLWQGKAEKIWATRPELSKMAVAVQIVRLMQSEQRTSRTPKAETIAKKLVKPVHSGRSR